MYKKCINLLYILKYYLRIVKKLLGELKDSLGICTGTKGLLFICE